VKIYEIGSGEISLEGKTAERNRESYEFLINSVVGTSVVREGFFGISRRNGCEILFWDWVEGKEFKHCVFTAWIRAETSFCMSTTTGATAYFNELRKISDEADFWRAQQNHKLLSPEGTKNLLAGKTEVPGAASGGTKYAYGFYE
jgi:hypothetical protein